MRDDSEKERKHTDRSLSDERTRTDHELAKRSEAAGEVADDVVRIARERARAVLDTARARADGIAPLTTEQVLVRAAEDAVLANEYEAADLALRDEREHRRLAVRQLLALERRATDVTLMLERSSVDQTMVDRGTVDLVVHDLRSLLQAVAVNAASIVLAVDKGEPAPVVAELATYIQSATAQSDILLGDLQELTSLEGEHTQLKRADSDVREIVRAAVDINHAAATSNGIALTTTLPDAPLVARVDAPRLTRVIVNLISNALKFTPSGGSIIIEAARTDGAIQLTIADTGDGIPAELREAIFERFHQGTNAHGRGRGLGLYIARAIVEAHGGRIWVDSARETGATFRVRLPA